MAQCDLMFSVSDFSCIEQAIIAFEESTDAQFPLDQLNQALAAFYQATLELPWLATVRDLKGPIGYLITARNDRDTDRDNADIFWDTLEANEMADGDSCTFLVDQPCWAMVPGVIPTVALGYITPYGPELPIDPINDGIRSLMGQADWPEDAAIYLYPVKKENNSHYSGLWLAGRVDNMDEDDFVDDAIFKQIREQNLIHKKKIPSAYQRKRYSW